MMSAVTKVSTFVVELFTGANSRAAQLRERVVGSTFNTVDFAYRCSVICCHLLCYFAYLCLCKST